MGWGSGLIRGRSEDISPCGQQLLLCLLAHAEGRLKFSGLWDKEDINQSLVNSSLFHLICGDKQYS